VGLHVTRWQEIMYEILQLLNISHTLCPNIQL